MKVKFVVIMEIDDTFAIDDDTGEKLTIKDLIERLKEDFVDYEIPLALNEIVSVEIEQ